jgi:hypothetical protein
MWFASYWSNSQIPVDCGSRTICGVIIKGIAARVKFLEENGILRQSSTRSWYEIVKLEGER